MFNNWLYRIRNNDVTPPVDVWVRIANELAEEHHSDNNFQHKIFNLEANPPQGVFERVVSELEKDQSFTERISNYEQDAPPATWNAITGLMDEGDGKVISIHADKISRFRYLRYAAAAIAAILLLTIVFYFNGNKHSIAASGKQAPGSSANDVVAENKLAVAESEKNIVAQNSHIAPAKETKVIRKTKENNNPDDIPQDYLTQSNVTELTKNPSEYAEKLRDNNGNTPTDITIISAPNSYINVTGPDGQTIKWSAKFSGIINYVNNNQQPDTKENIDIIIEESAKWRTVFAKWREKMTNTTLTPSLSNFMDIIDLSNILEDKK
ncbi:MAG: hypothetical protein JST86_06215 [Bacteroidetes bacterium]|nr:hypothetical protein [Bacteroidota bacterium]